VNRRWTFSILVISCIRCGDHDRIYSNIDRRVIVNSPCLTRSLRVLTSGVQFPGLALQSPGCEANWSKNLLFQIDAKSNNDKNHDIGLNGTV